MSEGKIAFVWRDGDWGRLKQLLSTVVNEVNTLVSGRRRINFGGSTLTNVNIDITSDSIIPDGGYLYVLSSVIGSAASDTVWRIKRVGDDGIARYPDGDSGFKFSAELYKSYTYT